MHPKNSLYREERRRAGEMIWERLAVNEKVKEYFFS